MSELEFHNLLDGNTEFLNPFAISLTRDTQAARDLFQDTICHALHNRQKYQEGTNIRAWLFVLMRNIFINGYRRQRRQNFIRQSYTTEISNILYRPFSSSDPLSQMHAREIQTAVARLPENFKKPLQLYLEGYRYHEIAHLLAQPLGTIKSRIHFARKQLRRQIGQD